MYIIDVDYDTYCTSTYKEQEEKRQTKCVASRPFKKGANTYYVSTLDTILKALASISRITRPSLARILKP